MQLAQTAPSVRHLIPVLRCLFNSAQTLFRRRMAYGLMPLDSESALPGLEVRDSTWEAWEAAVAEVRT